VGENGFLGDQEILFYCILMTISFFRSAKKEQRLEKILVLEKE
jgi:hypothetical protein